MSFHFTRTQISDGSRVCDVKDVDVHQDHSLDAIYGKNGKKKDYYLKTSPQLRVKVSMGNPDPRIMKEYIKKFKGIIHCN